MRRPAGRGCWQRWDCFVIPGSCESASRCLREKVGKEYWDSRASSMQTSPGIWQREKKLLADPVSAWVWPPIFCSEQQEVGNQGRFWGEGSGNAELACGCRDGELLWVGNLWVQEWGIAGGWEPVDAGMRTAGGWSTGLCGCLGNLRCWELGANPAWIWVEGVGDSGGVAVVWVGSWRAGSRHSLFFFSFISLCASP